MRTSHSYILWILRIICFKKKVCFATDKISFLSWIDDSVNQPVSRRLPFSLMVDLHLPTQTFETYLISLMQCKVKLDRLTTTNFSIDVFS